MDEEFEKILKDLVKDLGCFSIDPAPIECAACHSTYQHSYCHTLNGRVLCKGCYEEHRP